MHARIAVIGHRGWPARYPDNTLSGLIAASDVADTLEVDVRRSGDGKLVLSHDPSLAGMSVPGTSWSRLAELDLGNGHHPTLLDEALAALPYTPFQLEVKNVPIDPGFEPDHRIALEAAERARQGDVVTSFNPESLAAVRRVFPDVVTGLCVPAALDLEESIEHCRRAGHGVLVPEHSLVERDWDDDLAVFPWTVNDPGRAIELVECGVTGIITDHPGQISDALGG